jgi:hypothetical protein
VFDIIKEARLGLLHQLMLHPPFLGIRKHTWLCVSHLYSPCALHLAKPGAQLSIHETTGWLSCPQKGRNLHSHAFLNM